MNRPVRILHVFQRMAHGGAEMRTVDLMRAIDRALFHFDFCTLSPEAGILDAEIRALGGAIHPCALAPSFPAAFRRLLRAGQYDVVHAHVHYTSGLIMRLAAQQQVPIRVTHFRNTSDGRRNTLPRHLQRAIMRAWIRRHATDILGVNEGALALGWDANWRNDPRCRVIYNGLDPELSPTQPDRDGVLRGFHLPADTRLVIHIGRLDRQKNHPRLLALFAALAAREPAARLLLVYRGPAAVASSLRAKAAGLGLGDRVLFAGERSDVPRLLQAADLLLFPSRWEGLPGVVLEACLAGTPTLATDLPGVREIQPHFPALVHALSLDDADARWAETAHGLLLASPTPPPARQAAREAFATSIFHIRHCLHAHMAVWGRGHDKG